MNEGPGRSAPGPTVRTNEKKNQNPSTRRIVRVGVSYGREAGRRSTCVPGRRGARDVGSAKRRRAHGPSRAPERHVVALVRCPGSLPQGGDLVGCQTAALLASGIGGSLSHCWIQQIPTDRCEDCLRGFVRPHNLDLGTTAL